MKDILKNVMRITVCFIICFAFQFVTHLIVDNHTNCNAYYEFSRCFPISLFNYNLGIPGPFVLEGEEEIISFMRFRVVASVILGIIVLRFLLSGRRFRNKFVSGLIIVLFGYLMFVVPILNPVIILAMAYL